MSNDTNFSSEQPDPLRLALTSTHLLLVAVGLVNLLVVIVILAKPYMRTITNVYMISLCLADFLYLIILTMVAATQLNKSWIFGQALCTVSHGIEATGKYASVAFVVLLALDRYFAMCRPDMCSRYRSYRCALAASACAWMVALMAASPLFIFAEQVPTRRSGQMICIAKWPSGEAARWYIIFSSVLTFALPLIVIVFCYYHILRRLKDALKGSRRLHRTPSSRAPYHRVTRLVLWVVVFHVICWSPFWLFNLFSSISKMQISTRVDRIIVNIIHLFPYVNCALNPLVYALHAENFRAAFKELVCSTLFRSRLSTSSSSSSIVGKNSRVPNRTGSCMTPSTDRLRTSSYRKRRSHSVLKLADNNNHQHNNHHLGSITHCSSNSLKMHTDVTDV